MVNIANRSLQNASTGSGKEKFSVELLIIIAVVENDYHAPKYDQASFRCARIFLFQDELLTLNLHDFYSIDHISI